MKRLKYCLYTLLFVSTSIILLVYFCNFNNGFSNQASDWGNFGNYLSGVLSIINIVILIQLTISVSNADQYRTKAEIRAQKELLLIQIRKQSIESFYLVMNSYLNNKYMEEDNNKVVAYASEYLTQFLDTDFHYFDFGANQERIRIEICALKNNIDIEHNNRTQLHKTDRERFMKIFCQKDKIINELQLNALELTSSSQHNCP